MLGLVITGNKWEQAIAINIGLSSLRVDVEYSNIREHP